MVTRDARDGNLMSDEYQEYLEIHGFPPDWRDIETEKETNKSLYEVIDDLISSDGSDYVGES